MNFQDIDLKFANMRKPQNFTICPYSGNGVVTLQSDKAILQVDVTGETQFAVYNLKGCYFAHLSVGATKVSDFPKEIISAIIEKIKASGTRINFPGNVMYAEQTLTNLG